MGHEGWNVVGGKERIFGLNGDVQGEIGSGGRKGEDFWVKWGCLMISGMNKYSSCKGDHEALKRL